MIAVPHIPTTLLAVLLSAILLPNTVLAGPTLMEWIWPTTNAVPDVLRTNLPTAARTNGYVGSDSCRSCHAEEHASWHRTFHRTMTQPAQPGAVQGIFDGRTVRSDGLEFRLSRDGDTFLAEMPDPDLLMYIVQGGMKRSLESVPKVTRPVVMTTGSHHYQTYWVASARYPGLLQTLPLVFLPDSQRWIPREEAFLRGPGDTNRFIIQWNHQCIRCHSTAGNPGLEETTGRLRTKVGELGISCEACHGPGEKHVAFQRLQPPSAAGSPSSGKADPTIVNPASLDHRRSSEVCGQCHGAYILKPEFSMAFAKEGAPYRPGDRLFDTRYEVKHPRVDPRPERVADYRRNPSFFREQWWDDGTILAGGREFTGMSASKCYTQGEMRCVTCHSMHKSEPDDQLRPGREASQSCVQCHSTPKYTTELASHTHHAVGSDGSDCRNCHMPHTTYALFSAIRSHQIESPRSEMISRFGTPNACNLCHLDKTLAWTRDTLFRWYGQKRYPMTAEQESVSAAALWLLQGNAAQRVVTAWHVGWEPARRASGRSWLAPLQAQLLDDPYGVVREVGARSLRSLPGFTDFPYDFLAPSAERSKKREEALARWLASTEKPDRTGETVLIGSDGRPMEARYRELLGKRDNRPITIQE